MFSLIVGGDWMNKTNEDPDNWMVRTSNTEG